MARLAAYTLFTLFNPGHMEHIDFIPFKDEASSIRFNDHQTSRSMLDVGETKDIRKEDLLKLMCSNDFPDKDSWLNEAKSVLQIRTQVSVST